MDKSAAGQNKADLIAALEAASYYINRLERAFKGGVVRDLGEAEQGYHHALRAALASEPEPQPVAGWQDIASAPRNGTPFVVRAETTFRYLPYKPDGRRQMKAPGRWQRMTEYGGWENCAEPCGDWQPLPASPHLAETAPDQEGQTAAAIRSLTAPDKEGT